MVEVTDTGTDPVVWVTFSGSRVELDVASKVLTLMKDKQPELLGAYIGEAMCDTEPRPRRKANGKANGHVRG